MPGKLPGGKVRISKTAPSLISNTKVSSTSEVEYFGLIRDQALNDLESKPDALDQVLLDIQSPDERESVGIFKATDLTVIDGIVDFDIKKEDLQALAGGSTAAEDGSALVNPRFRIADRISQLESFTGRGIEFVGSGPVKFTYIVPREGDLLPGTVEISSTTGVVTGTGTFFIDESGAETSQQLNTTLSVGDFVVLYDSDGETLFKTGATEDERKSDDAIYKVVSVDSNTSITLDPIPAQTVTAGKKLRKRYCHNVQPPFFKEPLESTNFNSAEVIPSVSNFKKSHRLGGLQGGEFVVKKEAESWWEGQYNFEFRSRTQYGLPGDSGEDNPKFRIVKDGNLNFVDSIRTLSQDRNVGFKYDFFIKREYLGNRTFSRFVAQVNGHLKIDYYDQTGFDETTGAAIGTWKTAIDTTDESTFFREIDINDKVNNQLGAKEIFVQGGPNYGNSSDVVATNNLFDLSDTYIDEDGNEVNKYKNNYVPVVIRYWYGQDTIDRSSSPLPIFQRTISTFDPSFAIEQVDTALGYTPEDTTTDPVTPPDGTFKYWNSFLGYYELEYDSANANWTVVSTPQESGYETNTNELTTTFEVLAFTDLDPASIPPALGASEKNLVACLESVRTFGNQPDQRRITGRRVEDPLNAGQASTDKIEFTTGTLAPSNGNKLYIIAQNIAFTVVPLDPSDILADPAEREREELFQAEAFNPNKFGNYRGSADMVAGSERFAEQNTSRVSFSDNPEYFKYKLGNRPIQNTYGPDRYDGFIKNRFTTLAGDRDYDYSHDKLLFIGRQRKQETAQDQFTGNVVQDPKPLADGEVRVPGENYTFISVEEDAAGNGGNVKISGYPTNTLAALFNTAGLDNGGKILHSGDNSNTFNNALRQNNQNINISGLQFPPSDRFDSDGDLTPTTYTINYSEVKGKNIFFPKALTTNAGGNGTHDAVTRGMISSSGLGVNEVTTGTNGRTKTNKAIFIYKFIKRNYATNSVTFSTEEEKYFIDFLLATRPNLTAGNMMISVPDPSGAPGTGNITSSALFSNFGQTLSLDDGNKLYDGALIEFYSSSDDLDNSGDQEAGEVAPFSQAYVTGYDESTETITYEVISGEANNPANGVAYAVRVYYNYFEFTSVPKKLTDSLGAFENGSVANLSEPGSNSTFQIYFVYNSGFGFSRADNGAGLSFSETLFVATPDTTPANPQITPFGTGTELPSPPSVTVTPFDFDNSATDPANPGLGGLCYPPYQTQELNLKDTVANDATLYSSAVGNYDVWFGSPQRSLLTLDEKFLQVNQEFALDFSEAERPNIVPEGAQLTGLLTLGTFPTFVADSYTHKLRVNLSPYIGAPDLVDPNNSTGLFSRTDYNAVANDNIFKDALTFSDGSAVKEAVFLFAKKDGEEGVVSGISLLTDNDPGYV